MVLLLGSFLKIKCSFFNIFSPSGICQNTLHFYFTCIVECLLLLLLFMTLLKKDKYIKMKKKNQRNLSS